MKKISMFALFSVIALPAFATDTTVAEQIAEEKQVVTEQTEPVIDSEQAIAETVADVQEDVAEHKKSSFLHGVQIGVGVSGTSGLNGFIGYANKDFNSFWAKRFGVRFDFGTTSPIKSNINDLLNDVLGDEIEIGDNLTISDVDIDAHHYAALVDFYPFGDTWFFGGWRLTGGYYMGELQATAHVAGTVNELDGGSYEFELGGHQFKYVGNAVHGTAQFDWDYRGPYLGTGFDLGLFAGFKIYMDAGVVFTNKSAQLDLDIPFNNLYMDGTPVDNDAIKETVNGVIDETLADAQSELDDLKFYPIVKVGFMYRF
ncbi:MAG: hypothetical protein J6J82_01785 [Alphaproteobacteria bacterium]|nr:hypothetical protein [Alphaproteobacteria bacterium]